MNRIHWRMTARHGEIQVKEFDLEQTADAWVFLDLQRAVQRGSGDESTVEAGCRVAASVADKAILENRAVGLTVNAHRTSLLPADRGSRQHLKIMQLLAAVEGDGTTPLAESLVAGLSRIRRGMTVIVITSSLERDWVRPLATLRTRGVGCVVVWLDARAYDRLDGADRADAVAEEAADQHARAVRHALAEYELPVYVVTPNRPLGEIMIGGSGPVREAVR
jgi:uncharacterized protein (DUF58 family)